MLSPRRSLVLKTLVVVFLAALCLCVRFGDGRVSLQRLENIVKTNSHEVRPSVPPRSVVLTDAVDERLDLAAFTFATRWGREKDPALAAFSMWASEYTNAPAERRREMESAGIALAQQRRGEFKNLIRTQPKLALAETVPALVRNQLPSSISSLLEQRVTGKGDLMVLGRTDSRNAQPVTRRAVIGDHEYEAFVYGDRASQRTHGNISLHGVAIDGEIALSDSPLRVFEEGETVPADKPLAADSCPVSRQPTAPTKTGPRPNAVAAESGTHVYWMCHGKHVAAAAEGVAAEEIQFPFAAYASAGARSALVIVVDFSDKPGAPSTANVIRDSIASVQGFLSENSFGDFILNTHSTTAVLRMPRASRVYSDPSNPSGDSLLLSDARNAARTNGFNPDAFDFDIVTFVDIGFPWSGQGYVGTKGAWIQDTFAARTVAHELGHNIGLWHANSWNSNESAISPNGSHEEYGNPFDAMGRATVGFPSTHYSANFKHLLGWLGPDNITVVNGSGTFRLYAQDQNSRISGRSYALTIPTGIMAGDESEDYWIDFRQLLATFYPATDDGAILQWGNDAGTQSASRLLDMTVGTTSKTDSPLRVAQIFKDPDRGLEITPLGKFGSGAEAYLEISIGLEAPPIVDLAEALDNTNFTWNTSTPGWTGQRSVSHDGVDAAASAAIRNNAETYMETTMKGPAAFFFSWKVSSEEDFDFLKLLVDGQEVAAISGQVDWEKRGYELTAGPHTVRWVYSKDGGSADGADRAWVDEVTYIQGKHAPFINSQPRPMNVGLGDAAEFHIDAIGSDVLNYQWQKIDDAGQVVAIVDATNATFRLPTVQETDAGLYSCVVSNSSGVLTSSTALLSIVRVVSLADAVDNATLTLTTSASPGWVGQQAINHDGSDAAQSDAVSNGKEASLVASVNGPGTLAFWWKVSSEVDYDNLSLYVDGDLIEYHSGEFDWAPKSLAIPNGVHEVRWTYAKDANLSEGQDTAWIDEIVFTPIGNVAPQFVSSPAPQAVSVGGSAAFTAQYSAVEPVTYTWLKDGVALQPRAGLTGLGTDTLSITNVQGSDAGVYTLRLNNNFGSATSAGAALTIVAMSVADALDQPQRAFLNGGSANWLAQSSVTHDMVDAIKSGVIADEQFTWIETRVKGPANVAFWWKVSSEQDYDFLMFELDTVTIAKISGEVDWNRRTIALDSGDHVLRWKYQKDRNTPGGDDAGWVDQLEITPIAQPQITNVSMDASNISAVVQTLPVGGTAVLECSTNLVKWNPLSTNQISGGALNIVRPTTNNAQFLRIRIQ